jgi:hypothetical protein
VKKIFAPLKVFLHLDFRAATSVALGTPEASAPAVPSAGSFRVRARRFDDRAKNQTPHHVVRIDLNW